MEGGLGQFDAIYNILIMVVIITLIARQFNFPSTIAFILNVPARFHVCPD